MSVTSAPLSPLARTVATTATDIWNDSCAVDELEYAIAYRRDRGDGQPDDRPRRLEAGPGPLARDASVALAEGQPDAGPSGSSRGRSSRRCRVEGARLLEPAFEASRRAQGAALGPDRPDALP